MKHDAHLLHLRDLYVDISRSHHAAVFPSLPRTREGRSYPWWTCALAAIFHLSTAPSDIDSSTMQRMKRALKRHYKPTRSAGDHTVRLLATDLSMQHAAQLRLEDMEEGRKPGMASHRDHPALGHIAHLGVFCSLPHEDDRQAIDTLAFGDHAELPDRLADQAGGMFKRSSSPLPFPIEAHLQRWIDACVRHSDRPHMARMV